MNTHDEIQKSSLSDEENSTLNTTHVICEKKVKEPSFVVTTKSEEEGKNCAVLRYSVTFLLDLRFKNPDAIVDELVFKLIDFRILAHSSAATVQNSHINLSNSHLDMLLDEGLQRVVRKYETKRTSDPDSDRESGSESPVLLSESHMDMFLDKDLLRIVTTYQENRNVLPKVEPKWLPKDTEWTKSSPGTSGESLDKSDYLLNLVKNNKPSNLVDVTSIEGEMQRQAKADQLKKQIQANIKVVNFQIDKLKKACELRGSPKERKMSTNSTTPSETPKKERHRSESQSSSSTSSKKRKEKPEKVQQKPLSVQNSPLSKEEYLILSMLSLSCPIEREQYLIKVAKERNLLQKHAINQNVLFMNNKYGGILPQIREQAKQNVDQMAPCILQINGKQKVVAKNGERLGESLVRAKNKTTKNFTEILVVC